MEGETAPDTETAPEARSPTGDDSRRPDEAEKGSGVGHRDLYAIIGIAVVLFGIVIAFALLCPGAWETGQMVDDEGGQESPETPDEIEPPE
jgi:hypothetical protein